MNPLTCTDSMLHQLIPTLSISGSLVVSFSGRFLAFSLFPCLVQKYNVVTAFTHSIYGGLRHSSLSATKLPLDGCVESAQGCSGLFLHGNSNREWRSCMTLLDRINSIHPHYALLNETAGHFLDLELDDCSFLSNSS